MESTKKDVQVKKECPYKQRDPQKCVVCGMRAKCPNCQAACERCFYRSLCTHSH